jgi:DNA-directed RNA polymerase subunit RPC12/RpoP
MKRKLVLDLKPTTTKKGGTVFTAQKVENIFILNIHKDKELIARYCINLDTSEYERYDTKTGLWSKTGIYNHLGGYYCSYGDNVYDPNKKSVWKLLGTPEYVGQEVDNYLRNKESAYNASKRENAELRRRSKVEAMMERVPPLPRDLEDRIFRVVAPEDYALKTERDLWKCTHCNKRLPDKKYKQNTMTECPHCHKAIRVKGKVAVKRVQTQIAVMQPIDDEVSVVSYIDIIVGWSGGKRIYYSESTRLILFKNPGKYACDIYYNQTGKFNGRTSYNYPLDYFDNKRNNAGRRITATYLYDQCINETLQDTAYAPWSRLFSQIAAAGKRIYANGLMMHGEKQFIGMVELLFRGRFYKLLLDTSVKTGWSYWGHLNPKGKTIEETFKIKDRQKINRIRDVDGGESMVYWMQYADKTGFKISQETLEWLSKNNLTRDDLAFLPDLTLQKKVNYVIRQQNEGYKGKTAGTVIGQWKDYLDMCKEQKKDLTDEMVYKPRELKRRHDELVDEINKQRIIEEMKRSEKQRKDEAKRMRKKFPGAEETLKAIKPKYEFEDDTYKIIVPQTLMDIMIEGSALHHCAGATDRYFDRIMQQETYICFLRRAKEPDIPYYTIEVEPGGTIRQHRGLYDEEPNIEEIRPFLRKWQQEIKKRLKDSDLKLAKVSARKRQENIEDLRQKNNTRVLQGLMEDFMEAI